MKKTSIALLAATVVAATVHAQAPKPADAKPAEAKPPAQKAYEQKLTNPDAEAILKDRLDKVSYAIGMYYGMNLKRQGFEIKPEVLARALADQMDGKPSLLTENEGKSITQEYQTELRFKAEAKRKELAEKNKAEGEKFLAENKTKEGVVSLPSGLQYKVITPGEGSLGTSNDVYTVHYKGALIDGKEFDSSYKRGQPFETMVNGVIKGWGEALLLMKPGAKWQVFVPAQLAYGDRGQGEIGPGAALVFDMELLTVKPRPQPTPPPTPTSAQPVVTSDIIKVPSAEELKKGAKIEVIKASDVEKLQKEGQAKPAEPAAK